MYLIQAIILFLFLTICSLPVLFIIYKNTPDKGFALSPIITTIIISYSAWLLSSLKLLSFSVHTLFLIFSFYLGLNLIIFLKIRKELYREYKRNRLITVEVFIFIFLFVLFLLIRLGNPDLWHPIMGGEKPMDFAFLNSITNTKFFPPKDPWFSGENINYYYFGQVIVATLSKISFVPNQYFYNFVIPFLFAISGLIAFSTTYLISKSKIAGIISVFLLLIAGNWAQIKVIFDYFSGKSHFINSWYWTASRVMPNNEINEFPFFSFLYADLHAHLISIPLVISIVYLVVSIKKTLLFWQLYKSFLLIGFFTGLVIMTNIWDYPTVMIIISLSIVVRIFKFKGVFLKKIGMVLLLNLVVFCSSYITALPFLIHYKSGDFGISIYQGIRTNWFDFVLINGSFLVLIILFLLTRVNFANKKMILLSFLVTFCGLLVFLISPLLAFLILSAILIKILISKQFFTSQNDSSAILLIIISMMLFLIPDVVDFRLGLGRMNTVFKFYFQAWIFLSISAGWMIIKIWNSLKKNVILKKIFLSTLLLIFFITLCYPITATFAKINDRFGKDTDVTFNGMNFMNSSIYRDKNNTVELNGDYLAIEWIKNNIDVGAIIAEAQIPIYGWGSRISVYTGRQTILGWDWHEIAHRAYLDDDVIRSRSSDINVLYTTVNQSEIEDILKKYSVDYIYYGDLERKHYKNFKMSVFDLSPFLRKVYENDNTKIYKYLR